MVRRGCARADEFLPATADTQAPAHLLIDKEGIALLDIPPLPRSVVATNVSSNRVTLRGDASAPENAALGEEVALVFDGTSFVMERIGTTVRTLRPAPFTPLLDAEVVEERQKEGEEDA
jgi:hypothetical protein